MGRSILQPIVGRRQERWRPDNACSKKGAGRSSLYRSFIGAISLLKFDMTTCARCFTSIYWWPLTPLLPDETAWGSGQPNFLWFPWSDRKECSHLNVLALNVRNRWSCSRGCTYSAWIDVQMIQIAKERQAVKWQSAGNNPQETPSNDFHGRQLQAHIASHVQGHPAPCWPNGLVVGLL